MSDPETDWIWHFGQHWNETPDPAFQPGTVRIGKAEDTLEIEAHLVDACIQKSSYPWNHPAFLECDAFETFLGDEEAGHYFEFHVTPSNSILQLRFPIGREHGRLEDHMVEAPLFSSTVEVLDSAWRVRMRVPLAPLGFSHSPDLKVSFGRYDYSNKTAPPTISSTSPHVLCNFHRLEEWRVLKGGL